MATQVKKRTTTKPAELLYRLIYNNCTYSTTVRSCPLFLYCYTKNTERCKICRKAFAPLSTIRINAEAVMANKAKPEAKFMFWIQENNCRTASSCRIAEQERLTVAKLLILNKCIY